MKKRALISVYNKIGVVELAKELVNQGFEIVSTGGTETALADNGIKVTNISEVTGFPECLDGRVKTMHPLVHAGILAMRDNDSHMKQMEELAVGMIDIVVINLYPFRQTILKDGVTLEEAIENIDIGGPAMLRAAAKNWRDVTVLVDPNDYAAVIVELRKDGEVSRKTKWELALKVFEHTSAYDATISEYLRRQANKTDLPSKLTLTYEKAGEMRYGENPHQKAAFYKEISNRTNVISAAIQLHGKEMSYNNINDANGALDVIKEFGNDTPCVVAVKHANPCGVGVGSDIYEAYVNAYNSDQVSIFGGIVALNREVDKKTAEEMSKTFLEIIIAPAYTSEALAVLKQKKNIRLLKLPNMTAQNTPDMLDMKKVAGGILVQQLDTTLLTPDDGLRVVTQRSPTQREMEDLMFAWRVVKHVKSNAIVLAKDGMTTGIGPGQTNRVSALQLAVRFAGDNAAGSVMASDAFFPFSDCVDEAKKAGITAIIQPGGSIRDEDSVKACNEAGIAMVFTDMRHFKH